MLKLERPLVCLDTETTGEHAEHDRVVQIGLIKVYPDGRRTRWQTLVNPGVQIPPEITEIHHIIDADVASAPRFDSEQVAGVLQTGLHDCDVLGWRVRFDLRFFIAEFRRARRQAPVWVNVIDSARIDQLTHPRRLVNVYTEHFGSEAGASFETEAHDAMIDAEATLEVFEDQLAHHIPLELQSASIDEIAKWTQGTRPNYLDPDGKIAWRFGKAVINFGNKHLCTPLQDVDHGYLNWIIRGDFSDQVKQICRDALKGIYPVKA